MWNRLPACHAVLMTDSCIVQVGNYSLPVAEVVKTFGRFVFPNEVSCGKGCMMDFLVRRWCMRRTRKSIVRLNQRLVDLLSRDASAAGSHARPGALRPTAHPLRIAYGLKQQVVKTFGRFVFLNEASCGKWGMVDFLVRQWCIRRTRKSIVRLKQRNS
ncbi:hypothetical protein Rcae01_00403 [Novipirellula caenicola]|uniref:Uncharacterized protein n=1 Tax=Novipirellula caenicola TaxID=1536901 RepID=A0ABP9VIC5_9BACT